MSRYIDIKSLNGEWNLYIAEHSKCSAFANTINSEKQLQEKEIDFIKGSVPGNFELDMLRAGLIDDPFYAANSIKIQELENRHLWYAYNFDYSCDNKDIYIVFDGVDTFADVYLNGEVLGSADNMMVSHIFSADSIKKGMNEILVHIKPTVIEARKYKNTINVYYHDDHMRYNAEALRIRKAAHTFGWDIAPRFVSGGLWRGVKLAKKKSQGINEIYLQTANIENDVAEIVLAYELKLDGDYNRDYSLILEAVCGESSFTYTLPQLWCNQGNKAFFIENPKLWWPIDMGEQNLYHVTAKLLYKGEEIDRNEFYFGIRTLKLLRTEITDNNGSGEFCFYVNNEKLFIRGTNWVPLDAFHSRDEKRLQKALEMLKDVNCNMVRCWGGNVYEDHPFFEFCDKNGILVWQDFAMGCDTYPQDDEFTERLAAEVEWVVKKYRQHTSIALWAGDNECDLANAFWSVTPNMQPSKNILTRKVIPQIVKAIDPLREYLPSSPYVSDKAYELKDESILPENHLWGPRDYFKSDFYVNSPAHFASETGYHGCPNVESIKKFISPEKLWPWNNNEEWQAHATCMELTEGVPYDYRNALMASQVEVLFGEKPDSLERFSLMSQCSQAEAVKFFIERFRSTKWRRTGLIWWNLIDCWPQFSDAVVDYYYNKKKAYDYIKRSQQPLALMMREPENGNIALVGVNEFLTAKDIEYKVTDLSKRCIVAKGNSRIIPNSVTELENLVFDEKEVHFYLIEWKIDEKNHKNHYISGKPPYSFEKYINWIEECEF